MKQPTRAQLDPRPAAKPTAAELTRRLSVAHEANAALARSLGALRESDRARRELLRCALVALESVPDPGARDLELQAQIRANVARAADGYPPSRAVVAPDAASGKLSPPRATPGAPGTESASQSPSRASNRHRPNPASRGAITPELTPEAARANEVWEQLPRRARAAALGSEASTSQGVEP